MEQKQSKYQKIAEEAIVEVFQKDYFGLLALPLPEVKFLTKDEENYSSGEYYISVGNNWQIHLNFGELPKSVKEFKNEVKVLTRHEIEHYQTCPYDVMGQFRMIKRILETNRIHKNQLPERNISKLAGSIANQIADVIIDTKNFLKYPKETLISEINWIKKGSGDSFQSADRNGKLMFLLKEAIWKKDLELRETDNSLLEKVQKLAIQFEENGVTDSKSFLAKTETYTSLLLDLIELDKNDSEQQQNGNGASQSQGNNDSGESQNNEGNSQQQPQNIGNTIPGKDDANNCGQLVFQDPDKVESAINQLAQETSIDEFELILDIAGIELKDEKEKKKIWFSQQNVDAIPIISKKSKGSKNDMSYPSTWKLGDPIEDLDILLSLQISPKILPGITTKKWEKQYAPIPLDEKNNSDLLLVIDTSGSMGNENISGSRLHEALLACFGFIKFFEQEKGKIALINFSTNPIVCDWTKDYDKIKDTLLINQGSSTNFPIHSIERLTEHKKEGSVVVIITDGDIQNWQTTLTLLTELCNLENEVFLFLMDNRNAIKKYSELRNVGGFVEYASTVNDIRNIVFNQIKLNN
ncbi:VWA domain-containing protein [uncultured Lutibacter sp.]|uniref:vWA domain-containing protein n=1 Tax=uncultured Lutibacter sp. TaxID=437739 RepID=UPI002621AECF|nr:VWA domain-containing protein [uncultured Lutibacter sp.]